MKGHVSRWCVARVEFLINLLTNIIATEKPIFDGKFYHVLLDECHQLAN